MTDMLTRKEMISLNRALARRTGGRISVGFKPISVSQGIDLWNATESFESRSSEVSIVQDTGQLGETQHRFSKSEGSGFRRILGTGTSVVVAASLAGCATFGTNVNGDFACRAPDGICAPTSKIDDEALAMISGESGMTPAGPFLYDSPSSGVVTAAREPVRSGEKVLRIVFPAHIDGSGRFREVTAIHAVVERGAWLEASNTLVAPRAAARRDDLIRAAQVSAESSTGMPTLTDIASSAPEMQFHDRVAEIDAQNAEDVPLQAAAPVVGVNAGLIIRKDGAAVRSSAQPGAGSPLVVSGSVASDGSVPGIRTEASTVDPMASIKAQVAGSLQSKKRPARLSKQSFLKSTPLASSGDVADYSLPPVNPASKDNISAGSEAGQFSPVNRPSLFPVSEVKP